MYVNTLSIPNHTTVTTSVYNECGEVFDGHQSNAGDIDFSTLYIILLSTAEFCQWPT